VVLFIEAAVTPRHRCRRGLGRLDSRWTPVRKRFFDRAAQPHVNPANAASAALMRRTALTPTPASLAVFWMPFPAAREARIAASFVWASVAVRDASPAPYRPKRSRDSASLQFLVQQFAQADTRAGKLGLYDRPLLFLVAFVPALTLSDPPPLKWFSDVLQLLHQPGKLDRSVSSLARRFSTAMAEGAGLAPKRPIRAPC
jgi:hypothetical protein